MNIQLSSYQSVDSNTSDVKGKIVEFTAIK